MPLESYEKIQSVLTQLIPKLRQVLASHIDLEMLEEAWQEYLGDADPETHWAPNSHLNEGFMPWFYFNFRDDLNENKTLADVYRENAKFISHDELKLIEALETSVLGVWSVTKMIPGTGLELEDLITGKTFSIIDRMASRNDLRGLCLLARIATINGVSFFHSSCPAPLKVNKLQDLEEFRELLEGEDDMGFREYLIHEYFFTVYFNRMAPPMVVNSEGHELTPLRATFEIPDPQFAFERLKTLNHAESREELLRDATFYKSGDVKKVSFAWLDGRSKKKMKVLGFIHIDRKILNLEVNSEERLDRFSRWLKKNLKDKYKYLSVEEIRSSELEAEEEFGQEEKEEIMKNYLYEHYDQWIRDRIPALGNQRPKAWRRDLVFQANQKISF
jgi:acylphosphatase